MVPRTILYTGKGGVGKTSVASCTARSCAEAGRKTLVISTDPAHSLSESLCAELGPQPVQVAGRLWGQEVRAQEELERHWSGVRAWLGELFIERGVDRISAQELTVPPGMDELFSLLALQAQHRSGDWDVIVVDGAPTGETLRLLSVPDVARWWIEKIFPMERQILAAARPIARSLLDLSLPSQAVFTDIRRLSEHLIAMNGILRDRERSTIRLVMNPDKMVIGEAMRTFTYLNLYGYLTDAVVVNRIFPSGVGDYFADWRKVQEDHLELVQSAFAPVPVLCAPYFEREVAGAVRADRTRAPAAAGAGSPGSAARGARIDRRVHRTTRAPPSRTRRSAGHPDPLSAPARARAGGDAGTRGRSDAGARGRSDAGARGYAISYRWVGVAGARALGGLRAAYNRDVARTWILTGSPENHEATREHGFSVIGLKERNRNRALEIEPEDRIVLYATRVMAFAGAVRVEGECYEDREKLWPGKPGKVDAYPWRFATSSEIVLEESEWIPAESMIDALEHIGKWPREHWKLAFQGQIRRVSEHDAQALLERLRAAGGLAAATAARSAART